MTRRIRVLVVDDAAFMRMAVRAMLARSPEIELVGEGRNGREALELAQKLRPDVITMDVEMPEMDGVAATRAIMAGCPTTIVMVSSRTQRGNQVTIDALQAGAVDFVSKSSSFVQLDISQVESELTTKILYWGRRATQRASAVATHADGDANGSPGVLRRCALPSQAELVVVAVSTGGPKQLPQFLGECGPLTAPVIVAQHMPQHYTSSFAEHLTKQIGVAVHEGIDGQTLRPGDLILVPGGQDGTVLRAVDGTLMLKVRASSATPYHPCADLLFESCLRSTKQSVAVVLTGMGNDGTQGAGGYAAAGLPVLVQTPGDCVVGGMPQATLSAGFASHMATIEPLGAILKQAYTTDKLQQ